MAESNHYTPGKTKAGYLALILGFFLLAYILPLGLSDLIVPDETRYGEIPREMISTGDWIVPHLDGVRYFEKPVLGYWVHAASMRLLGENNFAVRLPSALAVGLSALLVFFLVFRISRRAEEDGWFPATLAALVFLSCIGVFGVGSTAVLDNLLAMFLTGSIAAFFLATEAHRGSLREKGFLILAGILCGLAFLTKGFLAFVVPALALAPYLAWQRRWRDFFRMVWLPILSALLVALPWSILIHLREPDFWNSFFWNEHIRRFLSPDAQHKGTTGSFLLSAPALFFPWLLAVPAAVPGLAFRTNTAAPLKRMARLCLCWLVLPFLFFSCSSGKLLTYLLPCFPPFAVLISLGLSRGFNGKWPARLFQWATGVCAVIFVLALLALAYIQFLGPNGDRLYSQPWKTIAAADGLLFYVILCLWALKNPGKRDKLLIYAAAPLLFFAIAHFIIPDSTAESKCPGPLIEKNREAIGDNAIVISDRDTIQAVCWYLRRDDVHILGDAGELAYGLGYEDAAGRSLDMQSAIDLIRRNPGRVVLIARTKKLNQWREALPEPAYRDIRGPHGYEVWKY
jgi:4-amino-4-deoxy-L-arabinose transferase